MFFNLQRPVWREDLPAALTVSALLLPQSLAYAMLSGLPPVVGVMASLLPLLAYALLGSSPTLGLGPVALLALVMAESIGQLAPAHGVTPTLVGMVLAIEVGALMAMAVLLRLHALSALLSAPVLAAFSSGSALAIGLGQLPTLLGSKLPGGTLIDWLPALWAGAPPPPHLAALGFGVASLVALLLIKRLGRHAPKLARLAPLALVIVVAGLATALSQRTALQGLPSVGTVSLVEGLRFPGLHHAPAALWGAALPAAALLALVAYVSSLAGAQALARKRGETLLPQRELLGLAAANLVAGASGGMPVAGSFSRSSVMHEAGARTRWTGAFTALAFALWITLGAGLLAALPQSVLAATIVVAVLPMIEWQPFARAWRYARSEALLMGLVALLVVAAGAGWALSIGVLGAIALLLQRTARPHWAEVGRLPGNEAVFRNVKRFEVELSPRLLAIRIDEGLCFTNARWLSDMLWTELDRHASVEHLVLMMSGVNDIDLSGLEALMQIATELKAKGKQLHFSELKGPVADRLNAAGLSDWLPGQVFRTQAAAWAALA
jgi:SulP family sulfate permease